jgi:hypothetical protein
VAATCVYYVSADEVGTQGVETLRSTLKNPLLDLLSTSPFTSTELLNKRIAAARDALAAYDALRSQTQSTSAALAAISAMPPVEQAATPEPTPTTVAPTEAAPVATPFVLPAPLATPEPAATTVAPEATTVAPVASGAEQPVAQVTEPVAASAQPEALAMPVAQAPAEPAVAVEAAAAASGMPVAS